jgi:hypothetical protein
LRDIEQPAWCTRATWRISYANLARNICVRYTPDFAGCARLIRESDGLPLATLLVQVFIEQSYSLTLQWPIRTTCPSSDNRAYNPPGPTIGPILNLKADCHWLQYCNRFA